MRFRFLAIAAVLICALAAAPANAAAPKQRDDVWAGQIVRHNGHFDYEGLSCPATAQICTMIAVRYRIVPLTAKAAAGLRRVKGGQARLVGYRGPAANANHNGTLFVRRVEKR